MSETEGRRARAATTMDKGRYIASGKNIVLTILFVQVVYICTACGVML